MLGAPSVSRPTDTSAETTAPLSSSLTLAIRKR